MNKYEAFKYSPVFKIFGNLSRAFVSQLGTNWAVYARSEKQKKVVNTHMFENEQEAILTRNEINR